MIKCLPQSFYLRKTEEVARDLVGMILTRTLRVKSTEYRLRGVIIETEAYGCKDDEASHAFRGITKRNDAMFGPVGRLYVYFTYGSHFCVNISARSPDIPAGAVLIRGIEPIEGIEVMKKLRGYDDLRLLASGPGRLTQALSITRLLNGLDVTCGLSELIIEQGRKRFALATTRVGITKATEKKWRFVDPASPYASRRFAGVS